MTTCCCVVVAIMMVGGARPIGWTQFLRDTASTNDERELATNELLLAALTNEKQHDAAGRDSFSPTNTQAKTRTHTRTHTHTKHTEHTH